MGSFRPGSGAEARAQLRADEIHQRPHGEEIQRAFVLHRFEKTLGGAAFGLVLWSLAFGVGHLAQGRDVAIATAALGAFWGLIYLRRRSVVSPVIAHAGFNLSEILRHAVIT